MNIQCPHCKEEFSAQLTTTMPDEQVVYISLKTESEMISAQTVAGMIKNTDSLMKTVAKDIGFKAHVFIKSIEQSPGELKIGFMIAKAA